MSISEQIDNWVLQYIGDGFSFRPHQKEAIINIIDNIVNTNESNVHIVEAPTGSGKSLINIISAGVLDRFYGLTSYILCSDLYLWGQYESFISSHTNIDFGCIKGQNGNYVCKINKEDIRNADCKMSKMSWAKLLNYQSAKKNGYECALSCPYVKVRRKALNANVVMMTYQLYIQSINVVYKKNSDNPYVFKPKDVIFCDECHNIPSIVQTQYSPTISNKHFEKIKRLWDILSLREHTFFSEDDYIVTKEYKTYHELSVILQDAFMKLSNMTSTNKQILEAMTTYQDVLEKFNSDCESLREEIAEKKINGYANKEDIEVYKITTWMSSQLDFWHDFNEAINESGSEYIVRQVNVSDDKTIVVTLNCAKEDLMVYKFLLSTTKHCVLTSATVGGHDAFDENIGMRFTDYGKSIMETIPSSFDFSKSPIFVWNRYKMSYNEKQSSFPHIAQAAFEICNKFQRCRGMIQTGSYEIAKDLYEEAPYDIKCRLVLYNGSQDKTQAISMHKWTEDSILIGPTLNEGIDLPDDLCRFIIIVKVPYPSLGNELVKAKQKLFPLWYTATTSNQIIQGIGRGVRNENDWAVTYILDACFNGLYYQTKEQYPTEMKARIKVFN